MIAKLGFEFVQRGFKTGHYIGPKPRKQPDVIPMIFHPLAPIMQMLRGAVSLNHFERFACALQCAFAPSSQSTKAFCRAGPALEALRQRSKLARSGFKYHRGVFVAHHTLLPAA